MFDYFSKRLFALLAVIALTSAARVVHLIRHAEKPTDVTKNYLSPEGLLRAQCIAPFFATFNITALYSESQDSTASTLRPLQTVGPLAQYLGLPLDISFSGLTVVQNLPPRIIAASNAVTLVSLTSSNIPLFMSALGVSNPPSVSGYDNIYSVRLDNSGSYDRTKQPDACNFSPSSPAGNVGTLNNGFGGGGASGVDSVIVPDLLPGQGLNNFNLQTFGAPPSNAPVSLYSPMSSSACASQSKMFDAFQTIFTSAQTFVSTGYSWTLASFSKVSDVNASMNSYQSYQRAYGYCPATPVCSSGQSQVTGSCCPSCQMCSASWILSNCNANISACSDSQPYSVSGCCPVCKPTLASYSNTRLASVASSSLQALPHCAPGVAPLLDSNSQPTCQSYNGRSMGCGDENVNPTCNSASYVAALPSCHNFVTPTRDPDTCCMTCQPKSVPVASCSATNCTSSAIASLRSCNVNELPVYNVSSCCLTCKLALPSNTADQPLDLTTAGNCTRLAFSRCMSVTPVCAPGDVPIWSPQRCCPSCVRPAHMCTPEKTVSCLKGSRVCANNEAQSQISGECCPTCVYASPNTNAGQSFVYNQSIWASSLYSWQSPILTSTVQVPKCNPGCTGSQVCFRSLQGVGSNWQAACVSSTQLSVVFDIRTDNYRRNLISTYTASDVRMFVNELVQRFCDTQSSTALYVVPCSLFQARGSDSDAIVHPPIVQTSGAINVTLVLPPLTVTRAHAGISAQVGDTKSMAELFTAALSDNSFSVQNYNTVVQTSVAAQLLIGPTAAPTVPPPSMFAPRSDAPARFGSVFVSMLLGLVLLLSLTSL